MCEFGSKYKMYLSLNGYCLRDNSSFLINDVSAAMNRKINAILSLAQTIILPASGNLGCF